MPGLNVITHCTAQLPFLANGGAIYGGASNRIEDCLFEDMPYGCGILISTTFPVGTNNFSGTTIAQRCDLLRCGGFDAGYGWRGAVQLCLDNYTNRIPSVNLNNLNISNSISDGLSIIGGAGRLSNAVATHVNIPNYGFGTSGRHGVWARSDAVGSMIFSNSTVVEASSSGGWNNCGAKVNISATTSNGYSFSGWTGSGSGSYSGTDNPASITMNGPITESAGFARIPSRFISFSVNGDASVTLTCATIPGFPYHLEATTNLFPAAWTTVAGSATNATGTAVTFTPANPPGGGQRYYRIASP